MACRAVPYLQTRKGTKKLNGQNLTGRPSMAAVGGGWATLQMEIVRWPDSRRLEIVRWPVATHVLRVPRHGTCRSSSGTSLQNQKRTQKINYLLLDDKLFDSSAIAGRHWRVRHLDAVGLSASSGSIEMAGDCRATRSNARPSGEVRLVVHCSDLKHNKNNASTTRKLQ